jgi:hypothetical protein
VGGADVTFLSLPTLLIAAAVAVPLLLLLYFLKLRRQELKISSTLLWKRAVHDLQVNAPFQRLRRNLLLFLQLLVLAALILALGRPVANFFQTTERTLVILVDRSASMKTLEPSGPRLDLVKQQAAAFVRNMGSRDRAMVIAFADRAQVVSPFTTDKRQLIQQIDAIEPTDGPTRLGEALQLAVAYGSRLLDVPGLTAPPASIPDADITLFSDGRIADADEQVVTGGVMRYYPCGMASDNVGIVGLDVRRAYERPGEVSVFVRVENFGPKPVKTDVTSRLDGRILAVREVELAGAEAVREGILAPVTAGELPASRSLVFELTHEAAGVFEVRIERSDALEADNVAYAPLLAPREPAVLGVGDRPWMRSYIERSVLGVAGVSLEWMTTSDYENADDRALIEAGRSKYDLVVFDAHDTERLPTGNYLFFGGVPRIEGVSAEDEIEDEHVANWDETHALMRYVLMDRVAIAKWRRLSLPSHAAVVVEGETTPIIAHLADPGRQFVIVAFDLADSDFPLKVPFVMFMQNAVRMLTAVGGEVSRMLKPGDTITTPVPRGATTLQVLRPDGTTDRLDVRGRHQAAYGSTHDVGVYRLRFDDRDQSTLVYAINLLDRTESTIAPNENFSVGGETIAREETVERVNRPLWPYAVLAALLVLVVEWWVYNRRVMI